MALSSFIPPFVVSKGSVEDVTYELYILNLTYAVFASVMVPLIIFCKLYKFLPNILLFIYFKITVFSDAPPTPPSIANQEILKNKLLERKTIIHSIKNILSIKPFLLYIIIDSINVGMVNSIQVLANQIVLYYYPVRILNLLLVNA